MSDDKLKNGIVAILCPDGTTINGTGFFITPDGYILTCYHVVKSINESVLFSWDEITGNDSSRFIKFLINRFGVDWVRTAKIDKTDDSHIKISFENKYIFIEINEKQTRVILTIDVGRREEFILKNENGKLNIYDRIKIQTNDNLTMDAALIDEKSSKDSVLDFSILKIEGKKNCQSLLLGKLSPDENIMGEKWHSVGYQHSREYQGYPIHGEISGQAPNVKNKNVLDIVLIPSDNIEGGLSGSPLVYKKTGRIIGIIKETRDNNKKVGYAIGMEEVFKKWPELEKLNLQARDVPTFFQKLCEDYSKKEKRVLVVGDVMLDHRMQGDKAKYEEVEKHEAGDNVYMLAGKSNESKTLGGAASVARMFSEIAQVTLIGVIGPDCEGTILARLCEENKIPFDPVEISKVLTTTKIYFFCLREDQLKPDILRFDREDKELMTTECVKTETQEKIISKVNVAVNSPVDCIVIKDHGKGMITEDTVKEISKIARNRSIPLFIDPKYAWNKFRDKDVKIKSILPNIKEASHGLYDEGEAEKRNFDIKSRVVDSKLKDDDYRTLATRYPNCENFIIKADRKGAVILTRNVNDRVIEIKPLVLDSEFETGIGCGDTFDAFVITGLLHGHTMEESVLFANLVAGIRATKKVGEVVSPDIIKYELRPDSSKFKKYLVDNGALVRNIELMLQSECQ